MKFHHDHQSYTTVAFILISLQKCEFSVSDFCFRVSYHKANRELLTTSWHYFLRNLSQYLAENKLSPIQGPNSCVFRLMVQQSPLGQGLLLIEALRSSLDTPQSVGLLWTSDQLVAETSTYQQSQQTNIHVASRIRTYNLRRRAAANPRLRLRGQWERHKLFIRNLNP